MASKFCGFKNPVSGLRDCYEERWKVGATYCAAHEKEYREMKRQAKAGGTSIPRAPRKPAFTGISAAPADAPEGTGLRTHKYVVNPELGALWNAEMAGMAKRPGSAMLWIGPSGSGKTDGAEALAAQSKLDFTKVDAGSMTDPEAWFGTREIVVQDGVAVTDYHPSGFVESIQKPGVTFIDEITRCRPEGINVLIPVIDHTRQVTNPLTGEIIHRHPQNLIIMAGNVGVNFVGTNAVDPAFWTRATKVVFDYLPEDMEKQVVMEASGCDLDTAYVLVQFAGDSRAKARNDDEFTAISTRELIRTGQRVADGLDRDLAVKFEILNGVSDEGGSSSIRKQLESIWNGKRAMRDPSTPKVPDPTSSPTSGSGSSASASTLRGWVCPAHGTVKVIPAGTSAKTGKPYASFKACGTFGCQATEDNTGNGTYAPPKPPTVNGAPVKPKASPPSVCGDCGVPQPIGRTTICISCGATL